MRSWLHWMRRKPYLKQNTDTHSLRHEPPISLTIKNEGWTPEEKYHHLRERQFWWTSLIVTIILACGAIASAWLTNVSLQDARNQAAAQSRESAKLLEQAKQQTKAAQDQVNIQKAGSRPYMLANIAQDTISFDGSQGSAFLKFKNYGTTPAVVKSYFGNILMSNKMGDPLALQAKYYETARILASGESTDSGPPISRTFENGELQRLVTGSTDGMILFIGGIEYEDIYGSKHSTHFCYGWPLTKSFYSVPPPGRFTMVDKPPDCRNDRD